MSVKDLKKELVNYINNTDDEDLLSLLKEDFVFYGKVKDSDVTDKLNKEQIKELKELCDENDSKDTQSLGAFKKATKKWRTK